MVAALSKEVNFSSRGSVGRAVSVQRTSIGVTVWPEVIERVHAAQRSKPLCYGGIRSSSR